MLRSVVASKYLVVCKSGITVYHGSAYKNHKLPTDYKTHKAGSFFGHGYYVSTSIEDAKHYGKYVTELALPALKYFDVTSLKDYKVLFKSLSVPEGEIADFSKIMPHQRWIYSSGVIKDELEGSGEVTPVAEARLIEKCGYGGMYLPKTMHRDGEGDWYTIFKPEAYLKGKVSVKI